MSILIYSDLLKRIIKCFFVLVIVSIGLMLFTLIIQMIFNLGNYAGVFLRVLYNEFCH